MRRHLADAVVPNMAFLVGNEVFGVMEGVIAAVAAGLVLVILRLARHRRLWVVFAAFAVVLVHAGTVVATGEGRDFFLLWLLRNIALTLVFVLSLVLGRPITLVLGRLVTARLTRFSGLTGDLAQHKKVTALWAGLWVLHLVVGLPLYAADMVVALGVAKFVMGPPALLVLGLLSWRLLARAPDPVDGGRVS
jgi:hypothetical protein